jgi:ribosomal protein S12 methylthiotransferase accessory factor
MPRRFAMEMTISFPGGKRVNARFGAFEIATDQSKKEGGDASAPEPFQLFLASIGTCAGVYILSFCQKRDIPTEGITLVQRVVRDEVKKHIVCLEVDIHVPPSFPEKYHGALVRAADQCAVKKFIQNPSDINVRVKAS